MEHKRIGAAAVRELCGGISDMSLWRWLADRELDFPRPVYIARRRYWKEAEILDWLDRQADEARGRD
jgi:predicted DNA-binding transcriptional regulator AlpA